MRRPERNIEIFSMSVLDMFASALGAFIMVAIILFPYYKEVKDFEKNIEKTKEAIKKSTQDLQAAKQRVREDEDTEKKLQQQLRSAMNSTAELDKCRAEANACRAALNKTFVVVTMEWAERCDVDMYIRDPTGRIYSYGSKTHPGSDAELSLDMRDGPGIEVWQVSVAQPGSYEISFQPLGGQSPNASIRTSVMDRSGRRDLRLRTVPCDSSSTTVARFNVSPSGAVGVQQAP